MQYFIFSLVNDYKFFLISRNYTSKFVLQHYIAYASSSVLKRT